MLRKSFDWFIDIRIYLMKEVKIYIHLISLERNNNLFKYLLKTQIQFLLFPRYFNKRVAQICKNSIYYYIIPIYKIKIETIIKNTHLYASMISCYLQNKSPQKGKVRMNLEQISSMITMSCKQTNSFKIHYDDITYDNKIINKIMLCGIIISYRDGLSPTKKPLRIIKLKDSTGICILQLFESREWEMIPDLVKGKNKPYVTVCAQAKSQGQFKYEIKLTITSLNIVKDYNQISLHTMRIIKDYIALKS